ncbi:hypothetical protein EAM_2334 [Erwinia amylovora ATCC 49946]|nr:hypothetical protein EAM01S_15_00830 [Erwinia amylovora NBRC 12687 = CFBP 1232]CBJ47008.1 hypothetical protein EAM_2334 [Erwinia amylovora ATCC 49946]CDK15838.1 hypothetical protein LA635_2214 [Erwinia amylovora LA635]CDK19204.1 hypothetical protein LA636_2212 [Erwinia amylovora LA636]CDK22575.1 hypothetical protein LA637_2215 [Erwinia amylovora LA637]
MVTALALFNLIARYDAEQRQIVTRIDPIPAWQHKALRQILYARGQRNQVRGKRCFKDHFPTGTCLVQHPEQAVMLRRIDQRVARLMQTDRIVCVARASQPTQIDPGGKDPCSDREFSEA